MADLIERLRQWAGNYEEGSFDTEESLMSGAADELEALRTALATERERADALEAALLPRPVEAGVPKVKGWQPTHKHVKRGSTYRFEGYGEIQTDTPLADYAKVAIYRAQDGTTWVRPVAEFHDGRFEVLPTSPATGGGG